MIAYKFEKGVIKTGIEIDLATDNQSMFEKNYGKLKKIYNDAEHTEEELEFRYAFVTVEEDDIDRRLILTKDKDEISRMEMLDKEYELAFLEDVDGMNDKNKPINFICQDGYCSWVEEEYMSDGKINRASHYISVSWM